MTIIAALDSNSNSTFSGSKINIAYLLSEIITIASDLSDHTVFLTLRDNTCYSHRRHAKHHCIFLNFSHLSVSGQLVRGEHKLPILLH